MVEQKLAQKILIPKETTRIWKNITVISIAFMIQFTATNGAINLQSSINAEAGLGTASLAAMFVGYILCSLFVTSVVIKWLSTKTVIFSSFITHVPYIAFQLYPKFYTLIPAAFLMGVGSGLLWCSMATYLSVAAEAHSSLSKLPAGNLLARFLGFFFMAYAMSQIWGNLISSLVISTANNASLTIVNETNIPLLCGSNFVPTLYAHEALPPQPFKKILILTGTYIMCIVGATIIVVTGLDSMKRYEFCRKTTHSSQSWFSLFTASVKQLGDVNQLLLLAISIFPGISQAFIFGDFTSSFISCAIGTGSVGYVMMSFGGANVVGCIASGFLVKVTGRFPVMCSTILIHGGLLVTLLLWRPHTEHNYAMFLIAVVWGFCDSVWLAQSYGMYGVQFRGNEEAAYSNLQLCFGVGNIISFVLSPYMKTRYKVYLLLSNLLLGTIGYLIVEYRRYKQSHKNENCEIYTVSFTKNDL